MPTMPKKTQTCPILSYYKKKFNKNKNPYPIFSFIQKNSDPRGFFLQNFCHLSDRKIGKLLEVLDFLV